MTKKTNNITPSMAAAILHHLERLGAERSSDEIDDIFYTLEKIANQGR